MGKVTAFCYLSGCTPEMAYNLRELFTFFVLKPGPLVQKAIEEILDDHEMRGQENVTAIGAIYPNGAPFSIDPIGFGLNEIEAVTDADIRAVPNCRAADLWEFGDIEPQDSKITGHSYRVSYGCCVMAMSSAVPIMHLATDGRLNPQRFWRLAMHQGMNVPHDECGFSDVDYGEVGMWREQFPHPSPNLSEEEIVDLEKLGDVEVIQRVIVHDGGFWMWMSPDRFPLEPLVSDNPMTSISRSSSSGAYISHIELLPLELLIHLADFAPLPDLIALASTSRDLRLQILGCDAIARSCIYGNAPWYIPVLASVPEVEQAYKIKASERDFLREKAGKFNMSMTWAYIRRCMASGSMRNRRRIWKVVEDIERVADLARV
ncbi:hypothetical protein BJ138DRAFT_926209 [Hygrophoropsis aurantiaca]|uniref:Uncharacterized protein n=1 Tax=Hygrophoropsis aurantiaca TaxID=72124 RepID=A0ACB8AE75_9AGAM|nr:hypothetical protein BJ138DRAFT_926209 [Hygrophoropsis aurantiaca]